MCFDVTRSAFQGTHDASSPSDSIRKRGENIDDRIDPLRQPLIAIPKLLKRLGLGLEYGFDCVDRVASLQLSGERIVEKRFSSLVLVLAEGAAQAGIEYGLEIGRRGRCLARRGRRHGTGNISFGSDGSRMCRVERETRGLVSRAPGTHCLMSPVNVPDLHEEQVTRIRRYCI